MSSKKYHEPFHPNSFNAERDSIQHYDDIANRFDQSWDGFLSGFFKRFIVKHLVIKEGESVLDIGCANGKLLAMLNEKRKINGTGLDISPEMVRVAQELHPNFNFVAGSAQNMSFIASSFDIIICSASFHHFPEPAEFLQSARKILKEDGRLIIAEIRIPLITQLYNRLITDHSYEGDVKIYSTRELQLLFIENGWEISKKKISRQIQYYELAKVRK
ncbi:MAG: class I SAM-dependent methyltransferase [Streptococcaceae bacterium]|jgi:ubiquinone/menaquinone biosynthesis C-methylase UbiE|nr:class I SAM-dependent methyltransferase [Streptococcaceae bacterium]